LINIISIKREQYKEARGRMLRLSVARMLVCEASQPSARARPEILVVKKLNISQYSIPMQHFPAFNFNSTYPRVQFCFVFPKNSMCFCCIGKRSETKLNILLTRLGSELQ
jgi:hypothetical protein